MRRTIVNHGSRGPRNPFLPAAPAPAYTQADKWQEAIVTDVIVNDRHPEYAADGYNIGAIQFRALTTDSYRSPGLLNWALPMATNITEYPLLNEIVMVFPSLNRFYYTRKINTSARVTHHAIFGLNEENSTPTRPSDDGNIRRAEAGTPHVVGTGAVQRLGKYFRDDPDVHRLRHDEGDLVIEGRSGQSVRFGAAWRTGTLFRTTGKDQSPNLLLRAGPAPGQHPSVDGPLGLVTEDIDKDASSVWLVSDQVVPLSYATKGLPVHQRSIAGFPKRLEGAQVVVNSDRIVLNSRADRIFGFSKKGIHWTTGDDFTEDTARDHVAFIARDRRTETGRDEAHRVGGDRRVVVGGTFHASAGTKYSIEAPKVYLGSEGDESQPTPLGAALADFLDRFLDIFIMNAAALVSVTSATGSPSSLNPNIVSQLAVLKNDAVRGALASFNSSTVFTVK